MTYPQRAADPLATWQQQIEARVAALERARSPRDAADTEALQAVAVAADGSPWTCAELWARVQIDERLGTALQAADVESLSELSIWCRRLRDVTVAGVRLERLERTGAGYRWVVVAV